MVMKTLKMKIKIYFTPRPMKPEFYNVLVYMYRFNKIMDRTHFSDQFQKITICHKFDIDYNLNVT